MVRLSFSMVRRRAAWYFKERTVLAKVPSIINYTVGPCSPTSCITSFDDAKTKRNLGGVGHRISFIEYDEFEGRNGFAVGFTTDRRGSSLLSECLDLCSNNVWKKQNGKGHHLLIWGILYLATSGPPFSYQHL